MCRYRLQMRSIVVNALLGMVRVLRAAGDALTRSVAILESGGDLNGVLVRVRRRRVRRVRWVRRSLDVVVLTLVSSLDVAEHETYPLSCVLRRRRHCIRCERLAGLCR